MDLGSIPVGVRRFESGSPHFELPIFRIFFTLNNHLYTQIVTSRDFCALGVVFKIRFQLWRKIISGFTRFLGIFHHRCYYELLWRLYGLSWMTYFISLRLCTYLIIVCTSISNQQKNRFCAMRFIHASKRSILHKIWYTSLSKELHFLYKPLKQRISRNIYYCTSYL